MLERKNKTPVKKMITRMVVPQGRVGPNTRRVGQFYPGRVWPVGQGPVRPQITGRVGPYTSSANNYNYYGSYQQGGRIGHSARGGRASGRISRFQPQRQIPQGQWQQQVGQRYTPAQPAEAYYQAPTVVAPPVQEDVTEEVEEAEEAEVENLLEQWNENLFLDAPVEVDDEGYQYEEEQVQEFFFGDDDPYG
jgi:hypothetical protein